MFSTLIYLLGNCSPVKGPVSDVSSCKKLTRKIPVVPERVLDAPNYVDDYCKFFACSFIYLFFYQKLLFFTVKCGDSKRRNFCEKIFPEKFFLPLS